MTADPAPGGVGPTAPGDARPAAPGAADGRPAPPLATPDGTRPAALVAHIVTGALVAFVALWRIGAPDAASDEYTYRHCAQLYVSEGQMLCNTAHPPLGKELLGVGLVVFGDTITTARLVTAVAAVATALFCYLFVRDVAGWRWGLVAGALWGLLPQAGVENGVSLEAIRIDRFALLDPFAVCFCAAALWLGWSWFKRGGIYWPALAGAACAAAACSKIPGLLVTPVALGVPIVLRARSTEQRRRLLREVAAGIAGCVIIVVAVYAPFGFHLAFVQIRDMIDFQSSHAARGTSAVIGHHFYRVAPWWSDLAYAVAGLSWPVAIALGVCCLAALVGRSGAALYALAASSTIWAFLSLGTHLSLPYYWIDWEPGVVVCAALGLRALFQGFQGREERDKHQTRSTRQIVLAAVGATASLTLIIASVTTVGAVATATIGPYQQAARAITCRQKCTVLYVGNGAVLTNYLPPRDVWQALGAPRGYVLSTKRRNIMVPNVGRRGTVPRPEYVVIDPDSDLAANLLKVDVRKFEQAAARLGYVRLPATGRLGVWRLG